MKIIIISMLSFFIMSDAISQKFFNSPQLFDPSPYGFSHIATVPVGSKLIFVAGQGGEKNENGDLDSVFRTQVKHSLNNIKIALQSQGISMNAVVKVTTLVVDHNAEKLKIIAEEFSIIWPKKNFPVNTLIPVPKLAADQC